MISIDNKRCAVVTGGARGIGRSIVKKMAANNINIVINYNNSESDAEQLKSELKKISDVDILVVKTNVADFEQCQQMVKQAHQHFGRIDILVNNAGITRDQLILRMTEENYDHVIDTNLKGCFNCTRHIAPIMVKQKCGRIINISSVAGIGGNVGQANYAASKAGMIGFTKSVAKELGGRNITVNAVAPGFIVTEMTDKIPEENKKQLLERVSLKRAGTGEDVADLVYFLASDQASYITGQVICVDGGLSF